VRIFLGLGVLLLGCALAIAARQRLAGAGSDVERSLQTADGRVRTYLVHVPRGAGGAGGGAGVRPLPLVLAFHGGGARAAGMTRLTHLDALADQAGFIAVYPQAFGGHWNDGREPRRPADDVAFVRALLARLEADYPVDRQRIFALGMSNGAFFSGRLACEAAGQIAAVAAVAGPLAGPLAAGCRPQRPIAVLLVHGDADPIVPYGGGEVRSISVAGSGTTLSAPAAAAHWARVDGCAASPGTTMASGSAAVNPQLAELPDTVPSDGTHVRREIYTGCTAGTEVVLYTVVGGGHTWPGGPQYLPRLLIGRTTHALDASAAAWEFFTRHPMP
jgi:polyhydroxybutyrate depolymerase